MQRPCLLLERRVERGVRQDPARGDAHRDARRVGSGTGKMWKTRLVKCG